MKVGGLFTWRRWGLFLRGWGCFALLWSFSLWSDRGPFLRRLESPSPICVAYVLGGDGVGVGPLFRRVGSWALGQGRVLALSVKPLKFGCGIRVRSGFRDTDPSSLDPVNLGGVPDRPWNKRVWAQFRPAFLAYPGFPWGTGAQDRCAWIVFGLRLICPVRRRVSPAITRCSPAWMSEERPFIFRLSGLVRLSGSAWPRSFLVFLLPRPIIIGSLEPSVAPSRWILALSFVNWAILPACGAYQHSRWP